MRLKCLFQFPQIFISKLDIVEQKLYFLEFLQMFKFLKTEHSITSSA